MEDVWGYIQKIIFFLFMISIIMECVRGMKCEKYIRSVLSVMFILIVITPLEAFVQEDFMDNAIRYFTNEMEQSSLNSQMETADDVTKELLRKEAIQRIQEKVMDLAEAFEINVEDVAPLVQYTDAEKLEITALQVKGHYMGGEEMEGVEQKFRENLAQQFELEQKCIIITLKGGEDS